MAVVIALTGAAPASAAPPWTAPVALPRPLPAQRVEANETNQAALVPRVSAGKENAGPQLVTWRAGNTYALEALDGTSVLRVRTSKTAVASTRYATTKILHFDARQTGATHSGFPTVQLGYRLGSADLSSFGSEREIGGPRTVRQPPVMAVDPDGAAVAAWHHIRAGMTDEIEAVYRPAGGHFGAIVSLAHANVNDGSIVGVGIDTTGRAVIAYSRLGKLAVRVISAKGKLSPESRANVPVGYHAPTEITVGTGSPGLVVVAWRGYPVTEGPTGHVDAAAAVLPVGSDRVGRAQRLQAGNIVAYPRGPIVATVDADGRPVVAWTVPMAPGVAVPMVAQGDNAGTFGAPQALDTSGSIGSLIRQDEGLAVGYLKETQGAESHGDPLGVYVARRGVDGAFAPGELVDDQSASGGADGLQPPGLGELPNGGLVAVFDNIALNATGGQVLASTR